MWLSNRPVANKKLKRGLLKMKFFKRKCAENKAEKIIKVKGFKVGEFKEQDLEIHYEGPPAEISWTVNDGILTAKIEI